MLCDVSFGRPPSDPLISHPNNVSDQEMNATPRRVLNRPHCVAALLAFVESSYSCMTSRGKPEECVSLASSSLKVTLWLLKCMQSVMELGEKVSEVETKNFSVSLNLVKKYLDSEFITCLLYIGKAEDKETHDKILNTVQHVRKTLRINQKML